MKKLMNNIKVKLLLSFLMLASASFAQDPNFYIFICFGQSNMEGNATTIPASYKANVDPRFQVMEAVTCSNLGRTKGSWYTAVPPLCRCYTGLTPLDNFGRTMVANLPSNIKIGVINVAVGGTKIELFDKDTYTAYLSTAAGWLQNTAKEYDSNPYARLVEMAKLAQKDGVIKGILLHQGESNGGDADWAKKVNKIYTDLMTDLSLDPKKVPLLAGEVVNSDQGGACGGFNATIDALPQTIPTCYVVSSAGCTDTTDNLHFNIAGYWEIGRRYANKMLSLLGPTVNITSPLNNANFTAPATVTIQATASTSSGTVSKLQFYNGTTLLGEDATAPYSYTWANVPSGSQSVCVKAVMSDGKTAQSCLTVKVNPAQAAYSGTPSPIPGKIEFENYDLGGNGAAYNDGSAGSSVTPAVNFRTDEDVDIENCTDAGTGYNIGFATAGEWLEYTVNVAAAGEYDLTIRAACDGDGRSVSLSANDVVVAKDIAIPSTAGWQKWADVNAKVTLPAGKQVLRLTIGASDYVNLNYMTFAAVAKPVTPLSLNAGWNLIGCPIEGSTDVAAALASIWANVLSVKTNELFYDKASAPALNTLKTIEWGQGYWVKVDKQCMLTWSAK